jgi:hypothetical protein
MLALVSTYTECFVHILSLEDSAISLSLALSNKRVYVVVITPLCTLEEIPAPGNGIADAK